MLKNRVAVGYTYDVHVFVLLDDDGYVVKLQVSEDLITEGYARHLAQRYKASKFYKAEAEYRLVFCAKDAAGLEDALKTADTIIEELSGKLDAVAPMLKALAVKYETVS